MKKNLLFNNFNSYKKPFLVFLLTLFTCAAAFAQNKQISGRIISTTDGSAIIGASLRVKGTGNGTITDVQGNFKLSVPNGTVLIVSYIGYLTQEVTIGDGVTYNIKMAPDAKTLVEVNVVAIGYGTAKRSDLTGAISSVSAATIAKVPVTSLDQSLQGRAAGVQVTNNDASPGGNVTVLIRGTGSLAQNGNGPLYVIDGYPVSTGGINNINPSDIASIDVLKDASATAIYGIRAANGVVIVTTKKGRKDGVQVSLDAYNAFQAKPKEYKVLDAQQFATLADAVAAADPAKQFNILPVWANPSALHNVDWQNAVYRSGLTQNYSLAIRGGNEKVQSSTSIGYYNQKGIVLGSYFKRLTLGVNVDYQALKWLKSSTSAKYAYQNSNNPYGTGSLGGLAQLPPTLDSGNRVTNQISDGHGNYGFFNPIYTYVAKYSNPVFSINTNQYQNINQYFLTNSSLEATILPGLRIKTNAGATITGFNGSYYQPEDDRLINQYGAAAGASGTAQYSQNLNTSFDWLWENTIAYDRTFGKHTINFVGGVSEQETTFNQFSGSGVPPNSTIRDISQVTNLKLGTSAQVIQSLASQFARLGYNYDEKYFITGTIRRDGSSKFDDGHKYGTFPSGAVSWKAKKESFLQGVDWLSDLKFRGSYGEVGNEVPIGNFAYESLYSTGLSAINSGNLGYPFGKTLGTSGTYQGGIASVQPENPLLRWETDYQTDIGTDISFLHGDLNLTVDWFNRRSKDFLLNIAVSPQTGYNNLNQNIGSMSNKGWEFALNYNHSFNEFKFGAGITVSAIKNTLTSLINGTTFITNPQGLTAAQGGVNLTGQGWTVYSETKVGQPVGEFYGFQSIGIIQSQTQLNALNAAAQAKGNSFYYFAATAPGDRLFKDVNGDGTVNASDEVSLGSPQPKFFGGLNLDGSYKAWDFNLYFYGVYGNKLLNYEESNLETFQGRGSVSIENVSQQYYQNAWTPANHSNTYARVLYNDDNNQNGVPSSQWIENGSFLKLKTVTIGYTLPTDLVKRLFVSKIRIYVSSQNLFTITSYKGLDPEVGTQGGYGSQSGVDNGTYPSSRYYTVGLNVTF